MSTPWVEQLNPIRGHTITGAITLVEKAADTDGARAINEQSLLALRNSSEGTNTYAVVAADHSFIGFALVSDTTAHLVVDPEHRRNGIGTALVERILTDHPAELGIWAHGGHPGAFAVAEHVGLRVARRLWIMQRALDETLPPVELPEGVMLRPFVPGSDDQMWLELNSRAFAAHPEQGSWSAADLAARLQEPWFSAAGFLIAERDRSPVGFHWTKVHTPGLLGEVYVVGVDPAHQGGGLGRALTLAGLHHLRSAGISQSLLYVDEENAAAIQVYRRLGFTQMSTDVCFTR